MSLLLMDLKFVLEMNGKKSQTPVVSRQKMQDARKQLNQSDESYITFLSGLYDITS
jgi:hypothetical protein